MTAAELLSRPLVWTSMIRLSSESRWYFQKLAESAHSNRLSGDMFAAPVARQALERRTHDKFEHQIIRAYVENLATGIGGREFGASDPAAEVF